LAEAEVGVVEVFGASVFEGTVDWLAVDAVGVIRLVLSAGRAAVHGVAEEDENVGGVETDATRICGNDTWVERGGRVTADVALVLEFWGEALRDRHTAGGGLVPKRRGEELEAEGGGGVRGDRFGEGDIEGGAGWKRGLRWRGRWGCSSCR
tara:strand:+ start:36 stop:488 length:453 start_codon:yes stop_codon:yes gene_type:complete